MKLTVEQLRHVVRRAIQEAKSAEEELLVEPDFPPDEEEDQEELKDMNEMKSMAAQNIIRDLLFKGSN